MRRRRGGALASIHAYAGAAAETGKANEERESAGERSILEGFGLGLLLEGFGLGLLLEGFGLGLLLEGFGLGLLLVRGVSRYSWGVWYVVEASERSVRRLQTGCQAYGRSIFYPVLFPGVSRPPRGGVDKLFLANP